MEHKLKVVAYAICKNESKHVDRWYKSVSEADEIYVLDTGSGDNTMELLKEKGVHVKQHIFNPWRFDAARNMALNLVPEDADVCVCTDLDEVFKPGWRDEVERIWTPKTTKIRYRINCSLDKDDNPLLFIYITKIHSRHNYHWVEPVHEYIAHYGNAPEQIEESSEIILNHYPDNTKPRNYLELLRNAVKDDPSARNLYLLARSAANNYQWEECIEVANKYLELDNLSYVERGSVLRYKARSYKRLKKYEEALKWIDEALKVHSRSRDNLVEKARIYYEMKAYNETINWCNRALKYDFNAPNAAKETISFDGKIFNLMANSFLKIGDTANALFYSDKAIILSPNDDDVKSLNKEIIHRFLDD